MNKQNLSKQEFAALGNLMEKKSDKYIINDSDKKLGEAAAEKEDVIKECKRQFYDINTYVKFSIQEAEMLIAKIQSELSEVVNKFIAKKECSQKEASFLLSKTKKFTIPHFISYGKYLKFHLLVDQL